jgi:type II secretory pathway component GspD/PulD (secretin)
MEISASDISEKSTVYLDADERTNRILMIGYAEQLAIVNLVIETLDVAQYDPRILKVYDIVYLNAAEAKEKLEEFELIGQSNRVRSGSPPVFVSNVSSPGSAGRTNVTDWTAVEETQVTILEATNSLLIKATEEHQTWIETVICRIDVPQQDMRALRVYHIQHVDAKEVEKMLSEFGLIGSDGGSSGESERITESMPVLPRDAGDEAATMLKPQVAVLESTNSLLINAAESQHRRMADIIEHVDVEGLGKRQSRMNSISWRIRTPKRWPR